MAPEDSGTKHSGEASVNWVPLIPPSHEMARNAWESVHAILNEVVEQRYLSNRLPWTHSAYEDAILLAYMALGTSDPIWRRRCINRLNVTMEQNAGQIATVSLFGGLCGLGWTVEHVSQVLNGLTLRTQVATRGIQNASLQEDLNEEVDAAVIGRLSSPKKVRVFDLLNGLVGQGVYFLERWPLGRSEEGLRLVVTALEEISERGSNTATWRTPPDLIADRERNLCPDGYYNLGVAHGVPGVLHCLCQIARTGVEAKTVSRLLDETLEWLIAQSGSDKERLRFKAWVSSGGKSSDARPVWCYGDLGVAAVLLQVAHGRTNDILNTFVSEMLETCLKLPVESYHLQDAGFCHGAGGIAHIYNRIYQRLGDERFRDAALNWYERLLKMFRPDTGFGGYAMYATTGPGGTAAWEPWPGLLGGSIGIALALLAAVTPVEPCWDRLMLLSSHLADTSGTGHAGAG